MLVRTPSAARSRLTLAFPSGRFLGALTPDQAAETVFPASKVRNTAGENAAVRALLVQASSSGYLLNASGQPAYLPGSQDCAGPAPSKAAAILPAIGGTLVKAASVSGPGAAPFVLAAGAVVNIAGFISGIFAHHHAAAVAKEQGTLCTAVPGAQNSFLAIDQAVAAGQMTAQQALTGLDAIVSNFRSEVSGILKGSSPTSSSCNAACVMLSQVAAIVAEKKSQYQDMIAAAASAGQATQAAGSAMQAAASSVSKVLGGTSFLPWAAAGLVLWFILKES